MRITFFTHKSLDAIQRTGFYATDLEILRELGHEVRVANSISQLLAPTDLYFVWWWTAAFLPVTLGSVRGTPTVITGVFNYDLAGLRHPDYLRRPRWHKALVNLALWRAAANVFVSSYEYKLVTAHLRVYNPLTIPLAVDTDTYSPAVDNRRDPHMVLNIAWSGRFNAGRKCLFEIVESVPLVRAQVPEVRYVLCGKPGHHHQALIRRVHELGVADSVEFRGYVDDGEKLDLMRRCAAYLSPSIYEGFGLAIAEAMSCCAPVVTSPVGSIPEVVADCALLVDGRDIPAIAAATVRLLQDAALRRQLGSRAREHILGNYRYEVRRNGLRDLIEQLA